MGDQNNYLNVTVLLTTLNVYFTWMYINYVVLSGGLVFIDFLHRLVIDHINFYFFRLMMYSILENQSCEAKG